MATLCFGCMKQKEQKPICEHCGFDERAENQPHQLPLGTLLQNQYLIGRVLGQGGFGITYMGWDQHLSTPIAIKEYFPGGVVQRNTRWSTEVMCATGEVPEVFTKHRERFLKEARTLAQLSGIPEIVQIRSFFPENGTAYIVMEYVEGITLKDHLKQLGRPLTEEEALAIMEPVLKALQKVHDHGLIHRDISPDNIMLPQSGGIKLIDFGTVRYLDDSGKSKSTEAVLKPGFAPMEQYNARGNLGTWTDVYAICATFHYLLTGKVPADVHDRMEQGENLTILRTREGISKKLISALEKGMKLRVQERVQSVQELYQLLYAPKKKQAVKQQEPKNSASRQKLKKSILPAVCAAAVAIGAAAMLLNPRLEKPSASDPVAQETMVAETMVPETTVPVPMEEQLYLAAEELQARGEYAAAAIAFGKLGGYSDARARSFDLWRTVIPNQTIAAGAGGAAVVKQDGSVLHITATDPRQNAAVNWRDIVSVSVGYSTTVGLKSDGTVVSLGTHDANSWTNMVAVDASQTNVMGLNADGTVTVTGHNVDGLCADWQDIVAISASSHLVGLKMDGTVVAAGSNQNGQCDVSHWKDIVAIASDSYNSRGITIGLKADGTVEVAGIQYDLSGWTDIVAVAASVDQQDYFAAGIRADGTILTAGSGDIIKQIRGLGSFMKGHSVAAISAARSGFMVLRSDGKLRTVGENVFIYQGSQFTDILLPTVQPLPQMQPQEESTQLEAQYSAAEQLLSEGETGKAAIAFGKLGNYKDSRERSFALWRQVAPCQNVSAGLESTAGVKADGTVLLVGYSDYRQTESEKWTDIISVGTTAVDDAGHTVGLKADGTVVAAGSNQWGQCDVSDWTDVVAIDVDNRETAGIRMDGTLVFAGYRVQLQQSIIQEASSWTDIVAVELHESFAVTGLKADGTVVTTGDYDVESWTDIVSICGGWNYVVGLKSDGTVVASGQNQYGQCDVSEWENIVAIDSGINYTMGLRADGTVLYAGSGDDASANVARWVDIASIYAGGKHALGFEKDGTLVTAGYDRTRKMYLFNTDFP